MTVRQIPVDVTNETSLRSFLEILLEDISKLETKIETLETKIGALENAT